MSEFETIEISHLHDACFIGSDPSQTFFTPLSNAVTLFPCSSIVWENQKKDRLVDISKTKDDNRKREFYAFLMGTHPKYGVNSQIIRLPIEILMIIWQFAKTAFEYTVYSRKHRELPHLINCKTLTTISLKITIADNCLDDFGKIIETSNVSNFYCSIQQSQRFMDLIPVCLSKKKNLGNISFKLKNPKQLLPLITCFYNTKTKIDHLMLDTYVPYSVSWEIDYVFEKMISSNLLRKFSTEKIKLGSKRIFNALKITSSLEYFSLGKGFKKESNEYSSYSSLFAEVILQNKSLKHIKIGNCYFYSCGTDVEQALAQNTTITYFEAEIGGKKVIKTRDARNVIM